MKPKNLILLLTILIAVNFNLYAWTSSNEGVCYTMDTLCLLSDSVSYNQIDEMYEVDCDIIILENDTLRILPGETVKFLSETFPFTVSYGITIYGCLIAIGEKNKTIVLGDPETNFSTGNWWTGLHFFNTSKSGESILKYCNIRGATDAESWTETALFCENSSPIIDHCIFEYIASGELTGGASAIGLLGQSYPLAAYCTFENILHGVAVWCNPYNFQDTVNYPSPLMIGCNIMPSVQGIVWPQCDHDKVVLYGGFLDNCYFGVGSIFCDTTLGYPIDTIGDGICTTTSTYELLPRFLLVDGVVNPRDTLLITGINEKETEILPTTSNYLTLNNNYPNPFSDYTTIEFIINNKSSNINLMIYDSKGNIVKQLIKDKNYAKGKHRINWYGDNDHGEMVTKGIYFYKLMAGKNMLVKKAIVVKHKI